MTKQKLISKLQKLRAITIKNGSSLSEVKTADKQYKAIKSKHGITKLDLEDRPIKNKNNIQDKQTINWSIFINKYINIGKAVKQGISF